jgi:alanine racemase
MSYQISHIARIINAEAVIINDATVSHLLFDSRKVYSPASSLFFAIKGARRNGHQFIPELYKKGVRNFVISEKGDFENFPEANFLFVNNTEQALQELAAFHRQQFNIPVIGITGSNGKTIVKEWLYQLLHEDFNIVRSPKSYNSQIGVPLSVWQMNEQHTLAIFEAGISQIGEMDKLQKIILPTIGVITNIGEAHSEGFENEVQKVNEKIKLLHGAKQAIFKYDHPAVFSAINFLKKGKTGIPESSNLNLTAWGRNEGADFLITEINKGNVATGIRGFHKEQVIEIFIPFTDDASIENAITCLCVLLVLNIPSERIKERMMKLHPVNMRLELKKGINNCTIINDSYSADMSSLEIALGFLDQQAAGAKKTIILSDFLQSAIPDKKLYQLIVERIKVHNVSSLIGIGHNISKELQELADNQEANFSVKLYESTDTYLQQFRSSQFKDEIILIKGARIFAFEQIVQLLEQKVHQTVLEINLNAIVNNLKEYQKLLQPSTKVMAMVKAFAYGSGGAEIAGILQYHKVDYLGVAYADEGVELRKAGISLPIMVMNPEENAFEAVIENNLEPEIYSFELLNSFDAFIKEQGVLDYPIHLEIETGMNRLGFEINEIEKLADFLLTTQSFRVQTVFTHLAASEDAKEDSFTNQQYNNFNVATKQLQQKLGYTFIRHIANSAAVIRFPQLQMDMVRLGIGLYGVDSAASGKLNLNTVATLKSTIAQIKHLQKGDSVSYNRKGVVNRDSVIATIRIGYADGYPRRLGNGIGKVWINGKFAPVVGSVCMDMFMVDITDIPEVTAGDEVIIFGKPLSIQQLAVWSNTIPYEVMTGISQRVKRVYFEE